MIKIAVEQPFTDVRQTLKNKGYQADMIHETTNPGAYDVLVVRHQDVFRNFRITGSLVETRGRTVNEIVEEVEQRLQRTEKVPYPMDTRKKTGSCGSFSIGILTGSLIGLGAALLLAPQSGKDMQDNLKESLPSGNNDKNASEKLSQVKEKANDLTGQLQEKAETAKNQVKEKISSVKEQKDTDTENETASSEEENNNSKNK